MNKKLGILLPLSALPGKHGIGEFGLTSYRFISYMSKNHYHYWQVLPLNPLGYGYSPYMSSCSLAIEYRYISLDELYEEGLLLEKVPPYKNKSDAIDYQKVGEFKTKYLKQAYKNYMKSGSMDGFLKFRFRHPWVNKYATFETFKELNEYRPWNMWKEEHINYFDNHTTPPRNLLDKVNYHAFVQYIAYRQYKKVLSYARNKNVKIIADVPFYVGYDSLEVWTNKDKFLLDEKYNPTLVAGVPPDAFSETGQLWGNPIYNYEAMKQDNYALLVNRIGELSNMCDYLRVDHFRAFDTYYVIPYGDKTAENGWWEQGVKDEFFAFLKEKYPHANLIAEDLGDLFPSVFELRDRLKLPGMYIAQFYLKEELDTSNMVVYTGTHDNQTLLGFVNSLSNEEKKELSHIVKCRSNQLFNGIIEYIMRLPSYITIIPMQDLLRLDDRARMNTPGTCGAPNFIWKMSSFDLLNEIKVYNSGKKFYGKR